MDMADDLLSTLVLATTAAVHPGARHESADVAASGHPWPTWKSSGNGGVRILGPGTVATRPAAKPGRGVCSEPADIAAMVTEPPEAPLFAGKRILLTAGPTWEAIDPVRGITNHSSGKMGYALADGGGPARRRGNPGQRPGPSSPTPAGVERVDVRSADEMLAAPCWKEPGSRHLHCRGGGGGFSPGHVGGAHKIKKAGRPASP